MSSTHQQDISDVEVLMAVASGDLSAFERLYGLYEKRVYHYVLTLLQDQALAEEIVVDVMLAVWRGAGTFTRTSRVSTWIFGIARHKVLDALRRTTHRRQEVDLDQASDCPHPSESPVDQLDRHQTATLTRVALSKLSSEHQEVLRLAFFEELPYEEISLLLQIPVNTVKTRVFYAKQQLKQHLARLGCRETF